MTPWLLITALVAVLFARTLSVTPGGLGSKVERWKRVCRAGRKIA